MKNILFVSFSFCLFLSYAQTPYPQDITIQLDENGEAAITSKDVLVNLNGTLAVYNEFGTYRYDYTNENESLEFIDELDLYCGISFFYGIDRNPINNTGYMGGALTDAGDYMYPFNYDTQECDYENTISDPYYSSVCNYNFELPRLFCFDKNGILYFLSESQNAIKTFDINSNIQEVFVDVGEEFYLGSSSITYDFDNYRLLLTSTVNNLVISIDIETKEIESLFTIPFLCGDTISTEYIGNDIMIVGNIDNNCNVFYTVNLQTQEVATLLTDSWNGSLLFIENEVANTTLSKSEFTCDDIGENIIDITIVENGETIIYQSMVTVVSNFLIMDYPRVVKLSNSTGDGTNSTILNDFTASVSVVSSCSSNFTVTQDPLAGTIIPFGEVIDVTLTATDEFNNTTTATIEACSNPLLSIDDQIALENSISVYPNPTSDTFVLENKNNVSIVAIHLHDINGKVIESLMMETISSQMPISIYDYAKGVYFVNIALENNSVFKRIIKN